MRVGEVGRGQGGCCGRRARLHDADSEGAPDADTARKWSVAGRAGAQPSGTWVSQRHHGELLPHRTTGHFGGRLFHCYFPVMSMNQFHKIYERHFLKTV